MSRLISVSKARYLIAAHCNSKDSPPRMSLLLLSTVLVVCRGYIAVLCTCASWLL